MRNADEKRGVPDQVGLCRPWAPTGCSMDVSRALALASHLDAPLFPFFNYPHS